MTRADMPVDIDQDITRTVSRRGPYAHLFSEYEEDEIAVARYWESLGCVVERLDLQNKRHPDFLLLFANGSRAICEVKSFGGPETGSSDYSLDYPTDLRISNALYAGIAQLREYSSSEEVYRILFFVNHNDRLKFESLVKLLDGEWDTVHKEFVSEPNNWSSAARLKRKEIDLYLWLRDTTASSAEYPSQYWGRLDRFDDICNAIQLNPKQIRLIRAA